MPQAFDQLTRPARLSTSVSPLPVSAFPGHAFPS